jgi:Na+/H+ antiporter NhaD/arsenite permease-like protein
MSLFSPELKAGGDLLRRPAPSFQGDPTSSVTASLGVEPDEDETPPRGQLVLAAGLGSLLLVPVFKVITGLPPYMGMLAGLGFLWLLTDALHFGEDRSHLKVNRALKEIDITGVLFFLGILLSIAALNAAGLLKEVAFWLDAHVPSEQLVAGIIGLASALVDNVPLVAATQGMYSLAEHPADSALWQLIAYCAGTGGSLLIIGSSAGVAYMGLSKGATFGWYAKCIAPWAFLGYLSGLATYVGMNGDAIIADQMRVTALLAPPL